MGCGGSGRVFCYHLSVTDYGVHYQIGDKQNILRAKVWQTRYGLSSHHSSVRILYITYVHVHPSILMRIVYDYESI